MRVRSILTVCSRLCKIFSNGWRAKVPSRDFKVMGFSRRKHLRYRDSLKILRRERLGPIVEYATREYLETDRQPYNELKASISDCLLTRLNKGWTLKETFGLNPEPTEIGVISTGENTFLNDFIFGPEIKKEKVRWKLNYNSLLTEFLTDMQIINS